MIPRGYPQVPTRVKIGLAPWFALVVIGLGVLHDHGVIDLDAGPPPSGRPPAATRDAGGNAAPAPSRVGIADIPRGYLPLYVAAAKTCPGLPWGVLAGIGKVETNHGRGWAPPWADTPGIKRGTENFAGAGGPMQFLAGTWAIYGRGGDRWDPRDAIPAAARLLCRNGARGGRDLRRAVYAYNHAWWYVAQVLALARAYQAGGDR